MKIIGPERYKLSFDATQYGVTCVAGKRRFSGIATKKIPKLYVISVGRRPIYVGVTRTTMSSRLRLGWRATGQTGYYGYTWRHKHTEANLDVWAEAEPEPQKSNKEIETIEAELVFLIRQAGQWPLFQTEIHFHPSGRKHRKVALSIARYLGLSED